MVELLERGVNCYYWHVCISVIVSERLTPLANYFLLYCSFQYIMNGYFNLIKKCFLLKIIKFLCFWWMCNLWNTWRHERHPLHYRLNFRLFFSESQVSKSNWYSNNATCDKNFLFLLSSLVKTRNVLQSILWF